MKAEPGMKNSDKSRLLSSETAPPGQSQQLTLQLKLSFMLCKHTQQMLSCCSPSPHFPPNGPRSSEGLDGTRLLVQAKHVFGFWFRSNKAQAKSELRTLLVRGWPAKMRARRQQAMLFGRRRRREASVDLRRRHVGNNKVMLVCTGMWLRRAAFFIKAAGI